MLLNHLPYYEKGTIKTKRYWCNVIGIDELEFDKLVIKGWFK